MRLSSVEPKLTSLPLWILLSFACATAQAGSLNPPGPPAPTMKTLQEVEPRTPIHPFDLPLTISLPGSYYLAGDADALGGGIFIAADNVTIDLNGFRLRGAGIEDLFATRSSTEVRNGTVSDSSSVGIDLRGPLSRVFDVVVEGASGSGISVGPGGLVRNCVSSGNSGDGYTIGTGAVVSDSTARNNGTAGFWSAFSARIVGCTSVGNSSVGIIANDRTVVERCTASSNGTYGVQAGAETSVIDSVLAANFGGVVLQSGVVQGCNLASNTNFGINVYGDDSRVADNVVKGTSAGFGISVSGARNRIDGNHTTGHERGIYVEGTGNFIVRNTSTGNSFLNYSILPGNDVGPIGTAATSTSPWANLQ